MFRVSSHSSVAELELNWIWQIFKNIYCVFYAYWQNEIAEFYGNSILFLYVFHKEFNKLMQHQETFSNCSIINKAVVAVEDIAYFYYIIYCLLP